MTRKPLNINDSDYGDNKLIKPAMIENLLKFISSDELDTYTNDQILTAYYELNYDTLSLDEYNDYIDLLYKKDDWDEDDWIDANLDEDDFQIYWSFHKNPTNIKATKYNIITSDINYPPHEHIYPDDKLVITKIEDISIYRKIIYLTKNGDEFYTYDYAFNYRHNFGFWQLFVEVFDK